MVHARVRLPNKETAYTTIQKTTVFEILIRSHLSNIIYPCVWLQCCKKSTCIYLNVCVLGLISLKLVVYCQQILAWFVLARNSAINEAIPRWYGAIYDKKYLVLFADRSHTDDNMQAKAS